MKSRLVNGIYATVAFVVTLVLFTQSQAMEIYSTTLLQAPSAGGVATYVYKVNGFDRTIGFVRPTPTTTQAAMWTNPDVAPTILPGLGGPNSLGDTATHEVGHWVGIVGKAQNPSGTYQPVLWVETPGDAISVHQLPTGGLPAGEANSVTSLNGTFYISGNAFGAGNQVEACVWRWTSPIQSSRKVLPSLGGQNSIVQSLCNNEVIEGVFKFMAVGSSQDASGAWRACTWYSDDLGDTWIVVDNSGGLLSSSSHAIALGNGFGRTGSAVWLSGVTLGFMDYTDDFDSTRMWLPTPPNVSSFADSVTATQFGHMILGRLRIDGLDDVPAVWKSSPWGKILEPHPLLEWLDPTLTAQFNPKEIGLDRGIAGEALIQEVGIPAIALPSGMNGPDVALIEPTQRGGSRTRLNPAQVWQEDGKFWNIKRDTRSSLPLTISTVFLCSQVDFGMDFVGRLRMRVGGTGAPASRTAIVTIKLLNQLGQKVTVASFNVNGIMQDYYPWGFSAMNYVHNDGEIYAWIETSFTSAEGRSMSFELFSVGQ